MPNLLLDCVVLCLFIYLDCACVGFVDRWVCYGSLTLGLLIWVCGVLFVDSFVMVVDFVADLFVDMCVKTLLCFACGLNC